MVERGYTRTAQLGRGPAAIALVVIAAALAPRIVVWQQSRASPTWEEPEGGDSIFYRRVARGEGSRARAYFHSPLYQGFLTTIYAVVGDGPDAPRVVQHLGGVLCALLCALLGWRLFRRRDVALIAGLAAGVSGPLIFYESQLLVDAILPLLLTAAALAIVEAWRHHQLWRWVLAGALVGVAALGRSAVLIWLLFLAPLVWRLDRRWRRSLLGLALGVAVLVAPITVRNYVVERDLVLITANGGLNFYIGNFEGASGAYALPEGLWFRPGDPNDDFAGVAVAAEDLGHTPSSSELSRWWTRRALRFIAAHPGRVAALVALKARLLVSDVEHPQLYHYYGYRRVVSALRLLPTAAWILVPGLLGVALVFSKRVPRGGRRRVMAWLAIAFAVSFLPFFVVGRFRAGWLALLSPFAARALAEVIDTLRRREHERTARWAAALSVVALLVLWPVANVPTPAAQYLAFAHASGGADRVRWARLAVEAEPTYPLAWARYGAALAEAGDTPRARAVLSRAASRHESEEVLVALARVRFATGDLRGARAAFERAIALGPGAVETWIELAETLAELGERESAIAAYRSALALGPREPDEIEAALRLLER